MNPKTYEKVVFVIGACFKQKRLGVPFKVVLIKDLVSFGDDMLVC